MMKSRLSRYAWNGRTWFLPSHAPIVVGGTGTGQLVVVGTVHRIALKERRGTSGGIAW